MLLTKAVPAVDQMPVVAVVLILGAVLQLLVLEIVAVVAVPYLEVALETAVVLSLVVVLLQVDLEIVVAVLVVRQVVFVVDQLELETVVEVALVAVWVDLETAVVDPEIAVVDPGTAVAVGPVVEQHIQVVGWEEDLEQIVDEQVDQARIHALELHFCQSLALEVQSFVQVEEQAEDNPVDILLDDHNLQVAFLK